MQFISSLFMSQLIFQSRCAKQFECLRKCFYLTIVGLKVIKLHTTQTLSTKNAVERLFAQLVIDSRLAKFIHFFMLIDGSLRCQLWPTTCSSYAKLQADQGTFMFCINKQIFIVWIQADFQITKHQKKDNGKLNELHTWTPQHSTS